MPISRLPELPCDTSVSNTGSSSAEAKLPSDSPVQNSTAESSTAITRDGRLLLVFAVCILSPVNGELRYMLPVMIMLPLNLTWCAYQERESVAEKEEK